MKLIEGEIILRGEGLLRLILGRPRFPPR